jgi:DEAD/DEAH box helicase domain-containing protein
MAACRHTADDRRATLDPRDVLDLIARAGASAGAGANAVDPEWEDDDEGLVHLANVPARPARTVALPDDLPELLTSRLALQGITSLYTHQAAARDHARAGQHVVVATGTASGKSLAYQLPVVEAILANDRSSALYLAPTKALARDQLRSIRSLKLPQVRAAVVDGDTDHAERDAIRRTANWLLTNPDLLHHSLLPGHARWGDLLHRLRYVIVDEAHVARGVFGGHVALVLRRLRRLCERYGADPTFLLASATIGNPAEHASRLVGAEVVEVVDDGAPRGPLDLAVWQPPFDDRNEGRRRSLLRETGDLLASFASSGVQTLVFTTSRKGAELVASNARERVTDTGVADTIRTYRAGYLPEERRQLEDDLRSGRIVGLAATEALELGIDVAGLDAVLLAGYPGTMARFWQRLGRAGRSGEAAVGMLVAGQDPLDQYLAHHPEQLLERPAEDAIIDPANPYLLLPHLECACHEQPMDADDASRWFGDAAVGLLDADVAEGRLRERGGRYHWIGRSRPSADTDIRSAGGVDVRIVDGETGALIGTVDEARACSQVHDGAIYLHQGNTWEVAALDLDRHVAMVLPAGDVHHTTRARSDTDVRVLGWTRRQDWGPIAIGLGPVEVTTQVTGYDVLRLGSNEIITQVPLDLPPQTLTTVAVWWVLTDDLLSGVGLTPNRFPGALHAAEHAAIGLLPLVALCDRWDIGGLSTVLHPDTGQPTVYIYDGYPGGAGLAERSFTRLTDHLQATRDVVADCRCADGCPSCVQSPKCGNGNEPLDKDGAVHVLDLLLSHAPAD